MFGNRGQRRATHPAPLDGSNLYAVEEILDSKVDTNGITKYWIKWLGWGSKHNTWEPADNIASKDLIREYEERVRNSSTLTSFVAHKHRKKGNHSSGSSMKKMLKKLGKSQMKTNIYSDIGSDVNTQAMAQMTSEVSKTKPIQTQDRCQLRSRSNSRSSSRRSSITCAAEVQTTGQLVATSLALIEQKSDSSESKQITQSKTSAINTSVVSDLKSDSIDATLTSDKFKPEIILERLPKLLLKRKRNLYQIEIRAHDMDYQMKNISLVKPTVDNNQQVLTQTEEKSDKSDDNNDNNKEIGVSSEELIPLTTVITETLAETEDNPEQNKDNGPTVEDIQVETTDMEVVIEESEVEIRSGVEYLSGVEDNDEGVVDNYEKDVNKDIETEKITEESKDNFCGILIDSNRKEIIETEIVIFDAEEEVDVEKGVVNEELSADDNNEDKDNNSINGDDNENQCLSLNVDTTDDKNEDLVGVVDIVSDSSELIVPDCSDDHLEDRQIIEEVCEAMIINIVADSLKTQTSEELLKRLPSVASPIQLRTESIDSELQNAIENIVEDMIETTVRLTETNIEFINNSVNEDIVEMDEQIEDIPSEQSTDQRTGPSDLSPEKFTLTAPVVEELSIEDTSTLKPSIEESSVEETVKEVIPQKETPVIEMSVVIDEIEVNEDIADEPQTTPEPIINNDDSIDANLMVRQPSNERPEEEDISDEVIEEVEEKTCNDSSNDAIKPSKTRLDFNNLINSEHKSINKDNDLLDLTFNDDIMLDTVENNYLKTVGRTDDTKTISKISDSLNDSLYSPISDDDREWSSIDGQSSPESVDIHKTKTTDDKQCSSPVVNVTDNSPKDMLEIGASSVEQNSISRQSSQLSEPSSHSSSEWTTQSNITANRVQTISFGHSLVPSLESHALPVPSSVITAQNHRSVTSNTPAFTSQAQSAQTYSKPMETLSIDRNQTPANSRRTNSSDCELQATSALLSGILLDNLSQDSPSVLNRLSPNHHINRKEDQLRSHSSSSSKSSLSPTEALNFQTSVITTLQSVQPSSYQSVISESSTIRTSIPALEPLVADASNWPLLNQTNPPQFHNYRPSPASDRMTAPVMARNYQFVTRPVQLLPVTRCDTGQIVDNQPIQGSPVNDNRIIVSEPRKRGRPPSINQVRSNSYTNIPNNSYQQMMSNVHQRQQLNAQQFPSPVNSAQMMSMRPDINTSNQPIITSDMRLRSSVPPNMYHMRQEVRGHQQFGGGFLSPQNNQRPVLRQMSLPFGTSNQSQAKISPYEISRQFRPSAEYNPHSQLRPMERTLSAPIQRPYQSIPTTQERPQYFVSTPSHPLSQTPFMSSPFDVNQKKITVEPKQSSEVREKLMQTMNNSPNRPTHMFDPHRNPSIPRQPIDGQEFNALMRGYHQKVGNEDNLLNKERFVERILDNRFQMNSFPYYKSQSGDQQLYGQKYPNQLNVPIVNTNTNINRTSIANIEPNPHILRNVLQQSPEQLMSSPTHPTNTSFNQNCFDLSRKRLMSGRNETIPNHSEPMFISEPLSPTNTVSSRTSKCGDKDILSEAMEEIVEYTEVVDEDHLINSENASIHNQEDVVTDDTSGQTTADENGQFICIPADKNPEDIMEYLKSHGFQVIESDSQESQSSEVVSTAVETNVDTNSVVNNEITVENNIETNDENSIGSKATDSQSENDLVIQFDENMLAEVTGDGSVEVTLVFDDNNNKPEDPVEPPVVDNLSPVSDENNLKSVDNNNNFETIEKESSVDDNECQIVMNPVADEVFDDQTDGEPKTPAEPTHYVSMPTFVFDSDNQNRDKQKQTGDEKQTPISEDNQSVVEQELVEKDGLEVVQQIVDITDGIIDKLETTEVSLENTIEVVVSAEEISHERVVEIDLNGKLSEDNDSAEDVVSVDENIIVDNNGSDDDYQKQIEVNIETTEEVVNIDDQNEDNVNQTVENVSIDTSEQMIDKPIDKSVGNTTECSEEQNYGHNIENNNDSENEDLMSSDKTSETIVNIPVSPVEKTDQIPVQMMYYKNDSGFGSELSLNKDINETQTNDSIDMVSETNDSDKEDEDDSSIGYQRSLVPKYPCSVSFDDESESIKTIDKPDDNLVDQKSDISNEDKPEDNIIVDKTDDTIATTVVIQKESVQHPFVSSSVEDFMPNSPSVSSISSPSVAIVSEQTKKTSSVVQSTDQKFLPELNDSEDEVIPQPTTTTKNVVKDVQIDDQTAKCQAINSLNRREVPQQMINHSIDNTSNQTKKSSKSGEKRKSKFSSKPPKKMLIREEDEKEYLHLIKSRPNGWDKGWTPSEIIGINSLNKSLVFLVKWTNDEQSIVLSEVAKHLCPQLVIKFYEKHSVWDE